MSKLPDRAATVKLDTELAGENIKSGYVKKINLAIIQGQSKGLTKRARIDRKFSIIKSIFLSRGNLDRPMSVENFVNIKKNNYKIAVLMQIRQKRSQLKVFNKLVIN